MTAPPDDQLSDRLQTALWVAAGLAILALLYALSPILTPFLLAGILAYICNPVTDRITAWGLPRMAAVVIVMLALTALTAGLILIILPLLYEEAAVLAARAPEAMALANEKLAPWLRQNFGLRLRFDPASLQKLAAGNWDTVQVIMERVYSSLKIGGVALVGLAVNLMLAPVVLFYLLLDWHGMIARVSNIVPRPWHEKIDSLATDIDAVLSQYLRGQILVMATPATLASARFQALALPYGRRFIPLPCPGLAERIEAGDPADHGFRRYRFRQMAAVRADEILADVLDLSPRRSPPA